MQHHRGQLVIDVAGGEGREALPGAGVLDHAAAVDLVDGPSEAVVAGVRSLTAIRGHSRPGKTAHTVADICNPVLMPAKSSSARDPGLRQIGLRASRKKLDSRRMWRHPLDGHAAVVNMPA